MSEIAALFSNVGNITLPEVVMWIIGGVLIYLGIRKKMEPSLLVPMGFGAILVNLPMSAAVTQKVAGVIEEGPLDILFNAGIGNELFLLLLFIGIGAMIDFRGCRAVRNLHDTESCNAVRLQPSGCSFGRHYRSRGRADLDLCSELLPVEICGRHHRCGVFLHGTGSDHPASGDPASDHEEGTHDSYGLQPEGRLEEGEDSVPDSDYGGRGNCRAEVGASDWFSDVR